ncbi:hypothetical protein GBAR_LOCUS29320 [Geodia barretti]|uniref:Uncharacterized protein n=1 Tax=Geodia barretti TaxID=519541 RepID=A0AA35XJU5_GEOBA|nr:hypothetical protein GBAR_LOCUS29320 [Geodia barretti]
MTGHWVCQCVRREKMTTGRLARKLATPTKICRQRSCLMTMMMNWSN